ncbi:MAG: CaiB/BaiF CoA transferase family protein, partial [Candidatus Binatia bacterium]
MSEAPGPLRGVRVVDTADGSAALAGRLLADMGAEVWTIEPPEGISARRLSPSFFAYYHAGKRSLVADPRSNEDRERLRRLLACADVWLDTSSVAKPSPWGLEPSAVAAAEPRLVVASVTPFGLGGPYAGYRANDLVAQAAGGMAFTNGHPGQTPLQGYGLQAYHSASLYALIGILLALLERDRSGRGQLVEVSLQEATASAVEEMSSAWNGERRIEVRRGSIHWTRAFAVGRCRDGYVMYCSIGDWTTLHEWLKSGGAGEELDGPEWDDFFYRRQHAEEIFRAMDRFAAGQKAAEVLEGAQLRRLPFAAVRPPEALVDDPQLVARQFFSPIDLGGSTDRILFPGPPLRMSATPLRTRSGPPVLG